MIESGIETLVALEKIKQTKARYQYYLDTKQWDRWADLFTEDFQWSTTGGGAIDGRKQFVAMTRAHIGSVSTVHQVHAPVLELVSPTTASGVWPMFDYVEFPGAAFQGFGYYHEIYRLEGSQWLISSQVLSRIRTDSIESLKPGLATEFAPLNAMIDATAALPTPESKPRPGRE